MGEKISQNRFAAFTPMDIYHNFQTIMDLFTSSCHSHHRGENSHRNQVEEKEDIHTLKTNFSSSSSSSSSSFFKLEKGIGLAMTEKEAFHVISSFPHLCLYNPYDLQERIRFMISSFPDFEQEIFQDPRRKYIPTLELDPYTIPWKGYGAGLSVPQATSAIYIRNSFSIVGFFSSRYHFQSNNINNFNCLDNYSDMCSIDCIPMNSTLL